MHLFRAADGTWMRSAAGASSLTALALPTGVTGRTNRPSAAKVRTKTGLLPSIFVGGVDPGTAWYELTSAWYLLGIARHGSAPSVAASGSGLTGEALCYINFRQKSGSTVLHQSNLSPSSALTLADDSVDWSSLPTTHANTRVTHVGLWRSMGGDVPGLVADLTLGTSSHTEAVSDAARQGNERAPTYIDANGETQVDDEARGIPPYCLYNVSFNYRCFYAGDPNFPSRLWRSRIGEPESVNVGTSRPTSDDTPGGEAITGLGVGVNNELVVFHATGAYGVEGFGDDTMRWRVLLGSLGFGCICHAGIVNAGGWLIYPSQQGICVYDGGFRNVMEHSLRTFWIDSYAARPTAFEGGWGMFNFNKGKYRFEAPNALAPKTFGFEGLTRPMVTDGEREPYWGFRVLGRAETYGAMMFDSTGMKAQPYYGGDDGFIRRDDVTDNDDDGDSYLKRWIVRSPHLTPEDPGGDDGDGNRWTFLDIGLKNQNSTVQVSMYTGHDEAYTAAAPSWGGTDATAIGAQSRLVAGRTATAKKVHRKSPNCSGKGAMVQLQADRPLGLEYTGLALHYEPGENKQGLT